jgi:hypothetical protein
MVEGFEPVGVIGFVAFRFLMKFAWSRSTSLKITNCTHAISEAMLFMASSRQLSSPECRDFDDLLSVSIGYVVH